MCPVSVESSHGNILTQRAVDAPIDEMLFTGGARNRRLLGGEGAQQSANHVSRINFGQE